MFIWTISDNYFSFLTTIFSARSKHYLPGRQASRQEYYRDKLCMATWYSQSTSSREMAVVEASKLGNQIGMQNWRQGICRLCNFFTRFIILHFGFVSLFVLWSEAFARILRHFIICLERNFNYLPYMHHHNPLLIRNRSWILTIHKAKGHST